MALRSLTVAGHLLLSAGIPSESTGVCFMQPDAIVITVLTVVIFSPSNVIGEVVQEFCVEYKKDDQMDCIMFDAFSPCISNNRNSSRQTTLFI